MPAPKISVIVPTYNQAEYLGACLDSIWFQDYPDIEIIVVADPGKDHTSSVLDDFSWSVKNEKTSFACRLEKDGGISRREHSRYPRQGRNLRIIENKTRIGHTPSYNKGFRAASGEYCTYVASDDLCHPLMLKRLSRPLINNQADFAFSDMFIVDDDMRILRRFCLPDYSFEKSFCDWYFLGVSKLYRLKLHEDFGYFNESYTANDHECYLRFALKGARFAHVPEVLYSVRSHRQRKTGAHGPENQEKLMQESADLVQKARQALKNR